MRWPPDVLAVMRRSRRHDSNESYPQRGATMRALRWATAGARSAPDYGCVDWYVYEEPRPEQEHF